MTNSDIRQHKTQENHRSEQAISALDTLLTQAGFDAGDLQIALEAIKHAKEQKLSTSDDRYDYYLERTLIYEDQEAFIYKRATSKSGRWYLRMYDSTTRKTVIRSLKTSDKIQALASARLQYINIKGKIERGERLKSITTPELISEWEKKLKEQVTDIPHQGITPKTYKVKLQFLKKWAQYIEHLSLSKTPIDKIQPERTRDFGTWLKLLPKHDERHKGARSIEVINNHIVEIKRMYRELAKRDRYISENQLPQIDKLKAQRDEGSKRDILNEEEYEKFWRYIQFNYITKKNNPNQTAEELEKRKIWKEFVFIMSNVGFRAKELIGIKMSEIMENPAWDSDRRETDLLMKVRKENSKTGRARVCVAPVKKRIQRILASYKKLGIVHEVDDFLFINPRSHSRNHYQREQMWHRLKTTLKNSGLQDELDKQGKSISLYSFRHQYAAWRLRYGDVPVHLLAKQMGTSIGKIESTYGHIQVEKQADLITKAQSHIAKTGYELRQPEAYEEDDALTKLAETHSYIKETVITHSTKKPTKQLSKI